VFKDLDRTEAEYHWVLNTWLTTPDLNHNEATLIRALKTALEKSLADFDQLRRITVQPAFLPHLRSAAGKAVAAGLLTDWNHYAEAT
jgi:hypothetical protein